MKTFKRVLTGFIAMNLLVAVVPVFAAQATSAPTQCDRPTYGSSGVRFLVTEVPSRTLAEQGREPLSLLATPARELGSGVPAFAAHRRFELLCRLERETREQLSDAARSPSRANWTETRPAPSVSVGRRGRGPWVPVDYPYFCFVAVEDGGSGPGNGSLDSWPLLRD
jgi:hypothetical protein